ncbi:MAG: hypothetical protein FD164_623 [Nitrospirae bacterium]|nr:MAG: hypothetical protein FD164_623 [Nitrospirota bacterium]
MTFLIDLSAFTLKNRPGNVMNRAVNYCCHSSRPCCRGCSQVGHHVVLCDKKQCVHFHGVRAPNFECFNYNMTLFRPKAPALSIAGDPRCFNELYRSNYGTARGRND